MFEGSIAVPQQFETAGSSSEDGAVAQSRPEDILSVECETHTPLAYDSPAVLVGTMYSSIF